MSTFFSYPELELQRELKRTAEEIVAPGKGILAIDEANGNLFTLLLHITLKTSTSILIL